MDGIEEIQALIKDVTARYELKIYHSDHTDVTLLCRFGITPDVFIQVYVNTRKEKLNLALIVSGNRIYGVDKEGGFYHEHPLDNPGSHKKTHAMGLEEFVIKSLELLKKLGFI